MKRIGILTGGGDAPGLNAVIRAVVKTAIRVGDCEVLGVKDGFDGFILEGGVFPLTIDDVRGILPRGGTILGTANRGNPFARKVVRDGKVVIEDISGQIIDNINALKLHALVVVGGDGTLRIASELYQIGVPVVGVPKTIDNDINGTEFTFGFDTAVSTATEAIDKLHTTAESHHRVMVLELMGRDAGFIALHAGVAGGADIILIPEIPFHYEKICQKVHQRIERGSSFSIVSVAEGAHAAGEDQVYSSGGDQMRNARLGGIGQKVGEYINEHCQVEARVLVLGHLQRGGSPTAFDRWLATRYGAAAARLAMEGRFGRMVALKNGQIIDVSLVDALAEEKRVDVLGDEVFTARAVGICFADE
jgi:phosphofructokinase-like protein